MRKLKAIAYLGPEGTFTHEAVKRYSPGIKHIACSNVGDVFRAVAEGEIKYPNNYTEYIDAGMVAYRNIKGGDVVDVLDLLLKYHREAGINIIDSVTLDIVMAIGGLCPKENVDTIISHPKALQQCRNYLDKKFPNAKRVETDSTAKGIDLILINESLYAKAAALASPASFAERDVPVYEENVADVKYNKTRFLLIQSGGRAELAKKSKKEITTVAIVPVYPVDRFSSKLIRLLEEEGITFYDHHLRPTGRDMDIHYFDLKGHIKRDSSLQQFLDRITVHEDFKGRVEVHNLGSYPYEEFFPSVIQQIGIIGASDGKGKTLRNFFDEAGYRTELARSHEGYAPSTRMMDNLRRVGNLVEEYRAAMGLDHSEARERIVSEINRTFAKIGNEIRDIKDEIAKRTHSRTAESQKDSGGEEEPNPDEEEAIRREARDNVFSEIYIKEMGECARKSDVIVINILRKLREDHVRAMASYLHSPKLLVVNSSKLEGEEERIRGWIEDEITKEIIPIVRMYREGKLSPESGTEKFMSRTIQRRYYEKVWNDNTSDGEIIEYLVREHCDGLQILCMDAMITDSFPTLRGQSVVFTPSSPLEEMTKTKEFIDIFHKHGAEVTLTDVEKHDKLAGITKNFAMLCALTYAEIMTTKGYNFDELAKYATPDVGLMMALMVKLNSGSPEADVTSMFEFEDRNDLLKRFNDATDYLSRICEDNPGAYNNMLKEKSKRLKDDKKKALEMVRICFEASARKK